MTRSKPRFVASINEASIHAACRAGYCCHRGIYPGTQSGRSSESACSYSPFAPKSGPVPQVGRAQTIAGVRKLVTRKYPYVVYYTVDEKSEEVIILTIQHPAQERNYQDA
jgi:hypothetical protein